jgi:hypothetical protein
MIRNAKPFAPIFGLILIATTAAAEAEKPLEADKRALAPLQRYVGGWRGVGQLRRGSNQGAWTEESQWAWRFDGGRAELRGELTGDKYFGELRLQGGDKPGQFVALATPAQVAGSDTPTGPQRFTGSKVDGALVLTADEAPPDRPARISVRLVAEGDRMVVLFEKRLGEGVYSRLAEVGSTRKGSSFAKSAASGPECVVTGGLGTIPVEYMGKKYFVCCTGCRDLFRDDPAGVLEDYRQRKAAEKAEKDAK